MGEGVCIHVGDKADEFQGKRAAMQVKIVVDQLIDQRVSLRQINCSVKSLPLFPGKK